MKLNRVLMIVFSLMVIAAMTLTACSGAAQSSGGKIKIGLSFSDFATERWKNEEVLMRKLLEEKGRRACSGVGFNT